MKAELLVGTQDQPLDLGTTDHLCPARGRLPTLTSFKVNG